jgi:hypothetical protein
MQSIDNSSTAKGISNSKTIAPASNAVQNMVIVNEVLCYAVGKFKNSPVSQLKVVLTSFYEDDELALAKDMLITQVSILNNTLLPRYARRKGDGRGKAIVDDLMDILSLIDENNLFEKLPQFAAVNLERVPTIRFEDMELYCMVSRLKKIEDRLTVVEAFTGGNDAAKNKMDILESKLTVIENRCAATPAETFFPRALVNEAEKCDESGGTSGSSVSWADKARALTDNAADGFTTVMRKKTQTSGGGENNIADSRSKTESEHTTLVHSHKNDKKPVIRGNKTVSDEGRLKSGVLIIKKSVLHVDNLDISCTVDILKEFVTDLKVNVLSCFTAKSWLKEEERQQVSAFRLCIEAKDRETVCSPSIWPSGVIIRDWIFKKPQDGAQT